MRWMVVVLVAACADRDGSGPYAALDQLARLAQRAECTRDVRCGMFPDQATCEATIELGHYDLFLSPELTNERNAGHLIYDGAMVLTCLDAIASRSCNPYAAYTSLQDCVQRSITPRLEDGETCSHDWACISGACEGCDWLNTCCSGTCGPPSYPRPVIDVPLGGACGSYGSCAAGLYCRDETCHVLNARGQPCTEPGGPGETFFFPCADGLECKLASGVCEPPAVLGEPCDLYCDSIAELCSSSGICIPQTPEGGACANSRDCPAWLACTANKCTASNVGDPCPCANSDQYCDYTDPQHPVCKRHLRNGDACTDSWECASGFCDVGHCSSC